MIAKLKKLDKRHFVYIALILGSLFCSFSFHFAGLLRCLQAFRDLATSVAYWSVWFVRLEPWFDSTIKTYDLDILNK